MGGTIALFAVMILSVTLAGVSIPIGDILSQEASLTVNDLGRAAQTKSIAQVYYYNYIPTAGEHSINQKAYELGKVGGGEEVQWRTSEFNSMGGFYYLPGYDPSCDGKRFLQEISCRLERNATKYFREKYLSKGGAFECNRPKNDFYLDVQQKEWIQGQISNIGTNGSAFDFSYGALNVTCTFPGEGSVKYLSGSDFLYQTFRVRGNRYVNLTHEANRTLYSVYQAWQPVDYYTDTSDKTCSVGTSDYEQAEQRAVNNGENDITSKFDSAYGSPSDPYFNYVYDRVDRDQTFTYPYGTTSTIFNGTEETSVVTTSDKSCNCHTHTRDDGSTYNECHAYKKRAKVNITAVASEVELKIRDERLKVVTEEGWKYLEFKVDPYMHFFTRD